jgi:hypothetical protein
VTAFSQKEKRSRTETHRWTDTPEQARARDAQKMLAGYSVRLFILTRSSVGYWRRGGVDMIYQLGYTARLGGPPREALYTAALRGVR